LRKEEERKNDKQWVERRMRDVERYEELER
jgi:hypothetical protein